MEKRRTLFIINPKAGARSSNGIQKLIEKFITGFVPDAGIVVTEYAGHAAILASDAVQNGIKLIVAVGGDGTVREVAESILHTTSCLGIVPKGSGNGLARHLQIPMDTGKALNLILKGQIKTIDALRVNGLLSVNISGVGFDAYVARLFAQDGKRGFITYAKITLREFLRYKPVSCKLTSSENTIEIKPFILIFANGSQWGNNAIIAPMAKENDGLITIGILQKPNLFQLPLFAFRLFAGHLRNTGYISYFQDRAVTLSSNTLMDLHIDGDPVGLTKNVGVSILPSSLKILTP